MKANLTVALLVFNRPEPTALVFDAVRRARPSRLLVVADGPRSDRPGETERVAAVRRVVEEVDWPCAVEYNYAERNLGCRDRVASGLSWVFDRAEEAIILEDDCLPDATFFSYCAELLDRYRDDERVGTISGCAFHPHPERVRGDYYASRFHHIWGWATWRRAWRGYDASMHEWPAFRERELRRVFPVWQERWYWRRLLDRTYSGALNTWDVQWFFHNLRARRLSILPRTNLITNIGAGPDATHTVADSEWLGRPRGSVTGPLRAPGRLEPDATNDAYVSRRMFSFGAVVAAARRRVRASTAGRLQASAIRAAVAQG